MYWGKILHIDVTKRKSKVQPVSNEWLKKYVRVVTNKIVSVNGLGKCVIEATDKASAHGETPDLLILNELVHVAKWEVMETHYNNASGVPRGVMVISTNAGYKGTKAEKWKQTAEKKPRRWHMHLWKKESPWLNDEDIEDARSINLPSEFARLFQGRWPSGKGEGITEEAIDNVFRSYLEPMTGNEEGWEFVAGLDMARTHDHAGLTVLGANKEEKRIRVAYLRDWKPNRPNSRGVLQIDSEAVKRTIVEVYKQFGITWFGYDPSEGAYMMEQELAVLGVGMVEVPFTGASLTEMVTALMKALPHLESYESEVLRRDLGKFTLVRKQPKGYRMKAVSDEYGHADVGTALLICLPQAVEIVGGLVPVVSENFFYSIEDEKEAEVEKARQADSFLDELLGGGIDDEDGDFRLDGHLLDM